MPIKFGDLELATASDIIVGGIGYAAGFAIDAFYFTGGATSPEVAYATAAGAVGLKYGIQAAFRRLRRKKKGRD